MRNVVKYRVLGSHHFGDTRRHLIDASRENADLVVSPGEAITGSRFEPTIRNLTYNLLEPSDRAGEGSGEECRSEAADSQHHCRKNPRRKQDVPEIERQ